MIRVLENYINQLKHKKKIINIYKKIFIKNDIEPIYTHKNNVYVVFKKKEKIFRKFCLNKKGANKIENDFNGIKWYCSRNKNLKINFIKNYVKKKNYTYLDTKALKGKKIKSWLPLSKNYKYIKNSLIHYKKVFHYKKKIKIHGDLTLENIFFNKNSVIFIDWEFFNSKKYWGYDAVYLVLSSICIPFIVNKTFSQRDQYLFKNLWRMLVGMPINKKMIHNPFNYFTHVIKNDKLLNQSRLISKSKFFPLITPKNFKKKIVNIIRSD